MCSGSGLGLPHCLSVHVLSSLLGGVLGGFRRGAETITINQTHEQKQRPLGCQYSHHRLHAGCGCGQPFLWSFITQSPDPDPVYTLPLRIKHAPWDMLTQSSIQCRCVCSNLLQATGAKRKAICSLTLTDFMCLFGRNWPFK